MCLIRKITIKGDWDTCAACEKKLEIWWITAQISHLLTSVL